MLLYDEIVPYHRKTSESSFIYGAAFAREITRLVVANAAEAIDRTKTERIIRILLALST